MRDAHSLRERVVRQDACCICNGRQLQGATAESRQDELPVATAERAAKEGTCCQAQRRREPPDEDVLPRGNGGEPPGREAVLRSWSTTVGELDRTPLRRKRAFARELDCVRFLHKHVNLEWDFMDFG